MLLGVLGPFLRANTHKNPQLLLSIAGEGLPLACPFKQQKLAFDCKCAWQSAKPMLSDGVPKSYISHHAYKNASIYELLTGVGHGNLVDLIGVQPDLPCAHLHAGRASTCRVNRRAAAAATRIALFKCFLDEQHHRAQQAGLSCPSLLQWLLRQCIREEKCYSPQSPSQYLPQATAQQKLPVP
eukprot:1146550-Pelagomonas_calceolata.AAC.2